MTGPGANYVFQSATKTSHPRLGFFGVLDERLDVALIDALAASRPDWHLVLVGPTVKIDPSSLPQRPNIHYLGAKTYAELPSYIAGWDVALFERREAGEFAQELWQAAEHVTALARGA